MNMQEIARLLLGLREKGWTDTEINDFLLYVETGEKKYLKNEAPKGEKKEN